MSGIKFLGTAENLFNFFGEAAGDQSFAFEPAELFFTFAAAKVTVKRGLAQDFTVFGHLKAVANGFPNFEFPTWLFHFF